MRERVWGSLIFLQLEGGWIFFHVREWRLYIFFESPTNFSQQLPIPVLNGRSLNGYKSDTVWKKLS